MSKPMRILFMTRYGELGASSRMRSLQYLPWLRAADIDFVVLPLIDDTMLRHKYQNGFYRLRDLLASYTRRIYALLNGHKFDLIWIEKEALPWFPVWFEKWLLRNTPYVLDFDDAIFHNYDQHRSVWIRRIYGQRLDRLMAGAVLVVAGNHYLAARATAAGTKRVEVIPTVIDLLRYTPKQSYSLTTKPRIVWIGSPSTVRYLMDLAEPLRALAKQQPFILRVIGGDIMLPGVEVESLPWTLETEAELIAECDIGIMPLHDTPWEQGKCAYKLIQYMASGLPTVASPIGANRDVVIEGVTGLFAEKVSEWEYKMALLLHDIALRQSLGLAGRVRVEAEYCLQQTAPKLVQLLSNLGTH
jgi:glycosyltransferase involved in cell wall biosynthesis